LRKTPAEHVRTVVAVVSALAALWFTTALVSALFSIFFTDDTADDRSLHAFAIMGSAAMVIFFGSGAYLCWRTNRTFEHMRRLSQGVWLQRKR
jgi:hypothetical protein